MKASHINDEGCRRQFINSEISSSTLKIYSKSVELSGVLSIIIISCIQLRKPSVKTIKCFEREQKINKMGMAKNEEVWT